MQAPGNIAPEELSQTGMRGAWIGARKEQHGRKCLPLARHCGVKLCLSGCMPDSPILHKGIRSQRQSH